ncbi:MAG: sulfatase-like hydrolase/transferase [Caldilineaceae bacterium]
MIRRRWSWRPMPAVVRQKFDRDHIRRAQANYYGKLAHLDDRVGQLVAALKRRGTWENTLLIFAADHGEYLGSHGKLAKGGFEEESAHSVAHTLA